MKKLLDTLTEKYNTSPAFAALAVTFVLTFFFQAMRSLTGHNDGNAIKLIKISTALLFMVWTFRYFKKHKPTP